jgi:1-acyl-sn-glycerol-3-phosphate acyltransferase
MLLFCRKIIINRPEVLKEKGPLLLACNHPNSFLDGVLMDALFEKPIWSLARGDVFKKPFHIKLLTALKIMPVYRTSEGVENLGINYETFDACKKIFQQNGIVLIFSEGRCINEWHLRPLKKGTARLAIGSWEQNIPLRVIPVGINYSSFRRFGKNIFINFGTMIDQNTIEWKDVPDGLRYLAFNEKLKQQFSQLVFEIDKKDKQKQKEMLEIKPSLLKKTILLIPATLGFIAHSILYLPVKAFVINRTQNNDHFDSVLMALLLVKYPFYLLIVTLVLFFILKSWWVFLLFLILPFTAWSFMQVKGQLD